MKDQKMYVRGNICLLIIMIVFCFARPVFAAETKEDNEAEVVRVGYYQYENFQEYDEKTEKYSGYSYEFLMALSQYTNWKFEFVPCTFNDALVMLENGELDLVNDVSKTADRESKYEFSNLNSGETVSYLVMKAGDTRVAYDDLEGIAGIKIGLSRQSIHSEQLISTLKERGVKPDVKWYDNHEDVLKAVEDGKVDAYITTSTTETNEHTILSFSPEPYYIAATKGNTKLMSEVNHAIESLRANNPNFEVNLSDKYYSKISENYTVFTQKEQEYIKENPVTRVLYVPGWYPLSYEDENGEFAGPIKGIYDLLEERTGLKFEFVPVDFENESNDIVDTYNCYVMADQPNDYSGASLYDVKLTQAFVKPPLVEISNHALTSGDTIALVEGDYLSEVVERVFGEDFHYVYMDSLQDCLSDVKNKKADGTILISYEAEYYRHKRQYSNLVYTIVNEGSYGLSIAVSNKADPRLYSIIVKGLNSISAGEISNIFNKTIESMQEEDFWMILNKNPVPVLLVMILLVALTVGTLVGWIFVRKLHEKNDELQKANEATKQFLARMSHDMRTPMNGILGISYIMEDQIKQPELLNELHQLRDSGDYLLQLINDVLDINKVESGNLTLFPKVCDEEQVFQSIITLMEPQMKEKNITFTFEKINIDWKWMLFDAQRVKQIFINLLSNAVKFTPEGGKIDFIMELISETDTMIRDRFIIRDNGIGMSSEFVSHAFEPFSQENKIQEGLGGSGLGLSIVENLVELMGGNITLESEENKGTVVTLYLNFPLADKPEEVHNEEHSDEKNVLKGIHILLCEDHPLNARIATRLLEKKEAIVTAAENGKIGLETFSRAEVGYFNVILMDIRMPQMDGLSTAKAIRMLDREDAKTIPIIAMTANAYDSDIQASLTAGMNAHLAKPIDPKKLYDTIELTLV